MMEGLKTNKRLPEKPTLYKCYKAFLAGASDEDLKTRGCSTHMIESMHLLHDEIVSGASHSETLKHRKVTAQTIKYMELLYHGQPRRNTRVATAYRMMLEGYTEPQMRNDGISKAEIEIAVQFRDNFAHRDMLRSSLSIELGVSRGVAQKLQEVVRTRAV